LCSGTEAVRKFKKAGWRVARKKGSHVMMTKADYLYTLTIPLHKELGVGILKKLQVISKV
jgi:predicted RNA binding protein YcfA (HicA-like mRNA interferase family)